MSVFGGIVLFTAGVAVGGGAAIFNNHCVRMETAQLRRENEHLRNSAWKDRLEYETDRAWRKGYREGRKHPIHALEELANTLEQHNATLKVRRDDRDG